MPSFDSPHRPHRDLGSSSKLDDRSPNLHDEIPTLPARQKVPLDATDLAWPGPPFNAPDSSVHTSFGPPGWKRLINSSLSTHERTSLITAIFSNRDEVETIRHIHGDDTQKFIDMVYEALDSLDHAPRVRCLRFLCKTCGRRALLPKQLAIVASYDQTGVPLGHGGFADVWKGSSDGRDVAIKVLKAYQCDYEQVRRRFCKEVVMWKALRHPNVLPLIGVTMTGTQFAMVTELMVNGNINQFVKAHPDADRSGLLGDVCKGLDYLHCQEMIHADLKGANILINHEGHARIADFGLLTTISDQTSFISSISHVEGGTFRWMSPELLDPERFDMKDSRPTKESDYYALGMVIYEVLSGQVPFSGWKNTVVIRKVTDGERPGRPQGARAAWFSDDLWKMLELCWKPQPRDRPGLSAILQSLEGITQPSRPPSPTPTANEDVEADSDDELDFTVTSPGTTDLIATTIHPVGYQPPVLPQNIPPPHRSWSKLIKRVFRPVTSDKSALDHDPVRLSDPGLWRKRPIFGSPLPKGIAFFTGPWLPKNSTDFLTDRTVAAVFSWFQLPPQILSTTALIQLRDTYMECLRAPKSNEFTRFKALNSAAAYYVLYHIQLIRSTSNGLQFDAGELRPDLFLQLHGEMWGGDDMFEYLLRIKYRSEPVTSARFLSYIAPYWFCGDSDSAIRFRPSRLPTLYELIDVLEENRAFNPVTLADCLLCAGAATDFPLHPEDLIRTDKSDYLGPIFRLVVEHVHGLILARSGRRPHTKTALEILLTLVRKTTLSLVDAPWINGLLRSASRRNIGDDTFTLFLRFSARRKEEEATVDIESTIVSPEIVTPESSLFIKILQNIRACSEKDDGWQDEAVYGGLIAMKDIPRLGSLFPESDSLETLFKAMEKSQPFRVRKAAYDVILVAREGWLRSADLRSSLEERDFPRQLHSVVIETGRSDHQRSFLTMMEVLSEDRYWHSYLRKAMDIWLPFRHEGPDQVIRILTRVSELPQTGYDGSPLDKFLEQLVENEWAAVPGRPPMDLTADHLEPLVEVTEQFKELLFTEIDQKVVLTVVEQVIPSLERRRDDGYEGPNEDIRDMVGALREKLQEPVQPNRRRPIWF